MQFNDGNHELYGEERRERIEEYFRKKTKKQGRKRRKSPIGDD